MSLNPIDLILTVDITVLIILNNNMKKYHIAYSPS